jgi:outer membrane protein assembly factor BamB
MRTTAKTTWILAALCVVPVRAQVSVLTQHNDNTRVGANLQETTLTVANVNKANFGKLAFRLVDGDIYAQPLIVSDAKGPAGDSKTMAIVATENNSVYAFDADNVVQASNAQLWRTNLAPAIDYHDLYGAIGAPFCTDITTQIGITSTPAIILTGNELPRTGVVFVTAKSGSGSNFAYNLYALDLSSGNQLGKTSIQGEVKGQGIGSTGSGANAKVVFNPLYQLNRPALALDGNILYVAFGGHCDTGPYHGWVFAYDVSNPKAPNKVGVFCVTPNGKGPASPTHQFIEGLGGIWMSGEGPAIDESGNVYVATGNGTYNGTTDFSDSVLKMKLQGGQLRLLDWFTPTDQVELKDDDYDLGSGGVALVPNSHLAIAGGKEGRLYLLDRNNLGKGASVSLQSFQVTHEPVPSHLLGYNIHGTAVIWPRDSEMYVYVMGEEDPLKQFRLVPDAAGAGWRFDPGAPFKVSTESAPYPDFPTGVFSPTRGRPVWMPGGFLELSANGTKDGTGILWVNMPFDDNANRQVVRGILRAFDASDVSKGEIWDSESTGRDNDRLGQFAKYCPPVVANGKVYVATFQQETILVTGAHIKAAVGDQPALVIYGPLASIPVPPSP